MVQRTRVVVTAFGAVLCACTALTGASDLGVGFDGIGDPDGRGGSEQSPPGTDGAGGPQIGDGGPLDAADAVCDLPSTLGLTTKLCARFDTGVYSLGGSPASTFNSITVNAADLPAIDVTVFGESAPSARFPFKSGTSVSYVQRTYNEPVPAKLLVSAAIRVAAPASVYMDLVEVRFGASQDRTFFVARNGDGSLVFRQSVTGQTPTMTNIGGNLSGSAFQRLSLLVENEDLGPYISIYLDEAQIFPRTELLGGVMPSPMTFIAGATEAESAADGDQIWYDDYLVAW